MESVAGDKYIMCYTCNHCRCGYDIWWYEWMWTPIVSDSDAVQVYFDAVDHDESPSHPDYLYYKPNPRID